MRTQVPFRFRVWFHPHRSPEIAAWWHGLEPTTNDERFTEDWIEESLADEDFPALFQLDTERHWQIVGEAVISSWYDHLDEYNEEITVTTYEKAEVSESWFKSHENQNTLDLSHEAVDLLSGPVRRNLLTIPGYAPYCGGFTCHLGHPRARWNPERGQFFCGCGWVSNFPDDFITQYRDYRIATQYCAKCGITVGEKKAKYCGDGTDKDNPHRWMPAESHESSPWAVVGLDRAGGTSVTRVSTWQNGNFLSAESVKPMSRRLERHHTNNFNKKLVIETRLIGENRTYHVQPEELDTFDVTSDVQRSSRLTRACATVRFQSGDPEIVGINGISNEALLAIVYDNLEQHQQGGNPCSENAEAIGRIGQALNCLQRRSERIAAENASNNG